MNPKNAKGHLRNAGKIRRERSLRFETLESRRVLSTLIDGGVNVSGNDDWSTIGAWVDVGNAFRRWGNVDRPWEQNSALTFTDQGVPLQDAGSISFLRNYGGGTYKLRYEGTGDVTFSHRGSIVAGTLQTVGGVTSADVNVAAVAFGDPNELLYLHLRNVDANDPVRNLRLVAPGYDVNTSQVFREEFVNRLEPFSTLRFMDWNRTNSSAVTSWDDRRLQDEFIQTGFHAAKGGVAWEYMVELANTTGNDAWINVPHLVAADAVLNGENDPDNTGDHYIRELARLWRDQLDPNLKVIVEYSNEPWNCQFRQCQGGQHDYYAVIAPRLAEISRIFHQEFAGQDDRLEVVLAGQNANSYHVRRGLEYFAATGQGDHLDAVATAPYFRENSSVTYTDLDSLFADISHPIAGVEAHAGLASTYGVHFYAYEGGQHLVPGNTSIELMQQAQYDPRMADEYERMLEIWSEAGGEKFAFFSFVGLGGQYGYWGMLDEIDTPGSQKWDTVMRSILPAGDATLDHVVAYDDFARLRDNYGTGQWWELGDFDGDLDADRDDFVLMFHNIDLAALTVDQCNEIYAFAATHNIAIPAKDAATVTISATDDQAVEESAEAGVFTFTRDQTNGSLNVSYAVSGSAAANDFVEVLPGNISFIDGQATATLTVTPVDDAIRDSNETIELTVLFGDDYFAGTPDSAVVTIIDDEPLVYEGFDQLGPLDDSAGGWGWHEPWSVWQNDDQNPTYNIVDTNPLIHDSLLSSAGYMTGGIQITGRRLDVADSLSDYLKPNSDMIGRDDTTLWMSVLMNRHAPVANGNPSSRISFHTDNNSAAEWTHVLGMGFEAWNSNSNGVAYWTLVNRGANAEFVRSDVPITLDEPTLLVMKIDFASDEDTVTMFVNPPLGGADPAIGSAQTTFANLEFKSLGYRSGNDPQVSSIDEIRIGTSFESITPVAPTDTTPPTVVSVELNTELTDPPDLNSQQPTDWRTQRSDLRSIKITFSEPVQMSANDVSLTNLGLNAPVDSDVPVSLSNAQVDVNGSVATIVFAHNELSDGVYQVELSPDVIDNAGNRLDGNQDGTAGDGFVLSGTADNRFYRLGFEFNGDLGVSVFDFSTFSYWFGQSTPSIAPEYADLNNDTGVSVFDFSAFSARFGFGVTFPDSFVEPASLNTLSRKDIGKLKSDDSEQEIASAFREILPFPIRLRDNQIQQTKLAHPASTLHDEALLLILDGVILDGVILDGVILDGVILDGVILDGVILDGVILDGGLPLANLAD